MAYDLAQRKMPFRPIAETVPSTPSLYRAKRRHQFRLLSDPVDYFARRFEDGIQSGLVICVCKA